MSTSFLYCIYGGNHGCHPRLFSYYAVQICLYLFISITRGEGQLVVYLPTFADRPQFIYCGRSALLCETAYLYVIPCNSQWGARADWPQGELISGSSGRNVHQPPTIPPQRHRTVICHCKQGRSLF